MPKIEFTVEAFLRVEKRLIVCGRCCETPIRLADRFTELRWRRFERSTSTGWREVVEEGNSTIYELVVDAISSYEQQVKELATGYTAGIRFCGLGLADLEQLNLD